MARYEAREGSGHQCCLHASVVDTTQTRPWNKDEPITVCECADLADAEEIAMAMNRAAMLS